MFSTFESRMMRLTAGRHVTNLLTLVPSYASCYRSVYLLPTIAQLTNVSKELMTYCLLYSCSSLQTFSAQVLHAVAACLQAEITVREVICDWILTFRSVRSSTTTSTTLWEQRRRSTTGTGTQVLSGHQQAEVVAGAGSKRRYWSLLENMQLPSPCLKGNPLSQGCPITRRILLHPKHSAPDKELIGLPAPLLRLRADHQAKARNH